MLPIVEPILKVIGEGIRFLNLLQSTSHVRRMRTAVDMAEKYIFSTESYLKETKPKQKRAYGKRMIKYRKLFFKFNQG